MVSPPRSSTATTKTKTKTITITVKVASTIGGEGGGVDKGDIGCSSCDLEEGTSLLVRQSSSIMVGRGVIETTGAKVS